VFQLEKLISRADCIESNCGGLKVRVAAKLRIELVLNNPRNGSAVTGGMPEWAGAYLGRSSTSLICRASSGARCFCETCIELVLDRPRKTCIKLVLSSPKETRT